MTERKTNKEIIDSEDPRVEHGYIKFPRETLIPATKISSPHSVDWDEEKIKMEIRKRGEKRILALHTHPYEPNPPYHFSNGYHALPSLGDLKWFESRPIEKTMVIVQRNKDTGEIMGYTMLFKKKKKEEIHINKEAKEKLYSKYVSNFIFEDKAQTALEDLKKIFNVSEIGGIKFHPMKDYCLTKKGGNYEKISDVHFVNTGKLEKIVGVTAMISILFGMFFLLPNITGNAFSSLIVQDSNILGVTFFLIGLIGTFLYFRKRNKEEK